MNARHRIGFILLCLAICGGAWVTQRAAETRRRNERPAVLYEVVRQQIEAVRAADFSRAYQQISTGFQEKFTIDSFTDLARSDYPVVRQAIRVEFGRAAHDGQRAVVEVYFLLPEGDVIPCLYTLVREDREWKIDAARLQKRWPAGRRLGGMRS